MISGFEIMKTLTPMLVSLCRLQKELAQKDNELKTSKKDYLVSQRHLQEEAEKVTQAQLKASKLHSMW